MASLIPAIGVCVSRMTGGEKRLAYRLEQKLEDDWLLWYDVPLGPRNVHPDFVVTHLNKAGSPCSDMAVIYCDYGIGKPVLSSPKKSACRGLVRIKSSLRRGKTP
ncbi:hypothetical protein [Quatrionicoccus australiensis]|uniref:hypothetical protein n=1 Tax=Quatrionicoccus australiensis TaxID=138118 RepID=UPI001CF91F71|nr:hypothetical protein [Quatrionicoccus australiensis]UCV13677.1 hypothetical protein KI612_11990 [Quatrionicoccus australiensis]